MKIDRNLMILNDPVQIIAVGMLGGIAGEVIRWRKLITRGKLPKYAKSFFYWILSLLMVCFGGLLALMYDITNAVLAFHVGVATAVILEQLAANPPPQR